MLVVRRSLDSPRDALAVGPEDVVELARIQRHRSQWVLADVIDGVALHSKAVDHLVAGQRHEGLRLSVEDVPAMLIRVVPLKEGEATLRRVDEAVENGLV